MTRPKLSLLIAMLVCLSLTSAAYANRKETAERQVSLCEVAEYNSNNNGKLVHLRAIYVRDLYHGAFLKDNSCPMAYVNVSIYKQDASADENLGRFEEATWGDVFNLRLRVFVVDISGIYWWSEEDGNIIVKKVWYYEKVDEGVLPVK